MTRSRSTDMFIDNPDNNIEQGDVFFESDGENELNVSEIVYDEEKTRVYVRLLGEKTEYDFDYVRVTKSSDIQDLSKEETTRQF